MRAAEGREVIDRFLAATPGAVDVTESASLNVPGLPAPRAADMRQLYEPSDPDEPAGSDSGRGLWLAATLADELSITSGPDSTVVALYMRVDEPEL